MTDHIEKTASGITKIVINDKEKKSKAEIKPVISALSDQHILSQKGGFLFNFSITENFICLGILPYFIEGARTHHYDIELKQKGKCQLFGFINPNASVGLLFKPGHYMENNNFLPGMADLFRDHYIRFARFLIEYGFTGDVVLDFGTKNILEASKLFTNAPETVKELAQQPAPFDLKNPTTNVFQ